MQNYDIKKERPDLYRPSRKFETVDVPAMQFLMVDGRGNPNTSPDYAASVEALFSTSYAIRSIAKEELGRVHTVGPLEGLWSAHDLRAFRTGDEDAWEWQLMIVQPDWITEDTVELARKRVNSKKDLKALDRLTFESFSEGISVQTLYVGAYDQEGPTIARMHEEFVTSQGRRLRGRHHEIYLSDARKTHPSRLRTVLRQPVIEQR